MAADKFYSSQAQPTVLTTAVNNSSTTIYVDTVTGWPLQYPFALVIDPLGTSEIVSVTNVTSLTVTIVRAQDGSTALPHAAGTEVRHMATSDDLRKPREHIGSADGVHGLAPGAQVVGTTTAQTLTNKTMDSANNSLTIRTAAIAPNAVTSDKIEDTITKPRLRLTSAIDATPTSTDHPLQIGLTAGSNLVIDENEILSRLNGVADTLHLEDNAHVRVPTPTASTDATTKAYVDGVTQPAIGSFITSASGWNAANGLNPSRMDVGLGGHLVTFYLEARSGSNIAAGVSTGNMADAVVGTLDAAYRPPRTFDLRARYVATDDVEYDCIVIITSAGEITLRSGQPGKDLKGQSAGATSLRGSGTWLKP